MLYRINDKIVDQLYVYKMKYIYGKLQRLIWYGSKISFQSVFITIWGTFQIELTNKSSCFFNWLYFFKAILSSQKNWGEDTDIPGALYPHTCTGSAIINISQQSDILVTVGEPALRRHIHPKSIVYSSRLCPYSSISTFCFITLISCL